MLYKKIASGVVFAAVFLCFISIGWTLVCSLYENNSVNQEDEFLTPEQIRDAVMVYIRTNHVETEPLMDELVWTGGRENTGLLGAEVYNYESQGWKMSISYPVVLDPIYDISISYSVPAGVISIPYSVTWEGTFENGAITEINFVFAQ